MKYAGISEHTDRDLYETLRSYRGIIDVQGFSVDVSQTRTVQVTDAHNSSHGLRRVLTLSHRYMLHRDSLRYARYVTLMHRARGHYKTDPGLCSR